MITVHVEADAEAAACHAAGLIADAVRADPGLVLGLATGETMRPVYAALARDRARRGTSWRGVAVFNLDDYVGVPADHPASFRRFMRETLFDHLDILPERVSMPDGSAADLAGAALRYEAAIAAAGGIGLQLLGIGGNGHIAFNEPGSDVASRTRVVDLAPSTVAAARRGFGDDVPRRGITVGIGTILAARRILLVATGAGKAGPVADALRAPPSPSRPASALQAHGNVTFVLDRQAAL